MARAQQQFADLDSLVREALAINPALQAARHRAEAAERVPSQVGSLPDPTLGMNLSNFRLDDPSISASPMSGVQLALRQDVPFPGKLGRRRDVAQANAYAEQSRVVLQEANLIARVKSAYWDYYFTDASEAITRDNTDILNTLVGIANSRFAVGEAAQQDVLKAQVAYAELRNALLAREQETATQRERLNTTVGRNAKTPLGKPLPPMAEEPVFDSEAILALAMESSPRLKVRRDLVERARRSVREARFDRWSDLQLAGGYRFRGIVPGDRTDGADMFFLSLGLSLPIYARSKQNKRVQETMQRVEDAEQQLADTELLVRFEVQRFLDEIGRLSRQEKIYRTEILPEAQMALSASLVDYQVAKVEFISVLDNWRRLFNAQIAYERLLSDRASRVAELEAVVGRPLP